MRMRIRQGRAPRSWTRITGTAACGLAAVSLTLAAAGCGSSGSASSGGPSAPSSAALPGTGKPTIILGDKNFDEEFLLGEIYAQAFRAKGYTVQIKPNIGGSSLINHVFQAGQINAYPEYLGEVVATDAGYSKPLTSEAQTLRLATAYEQKHGATIMTPVTPFYDTDELVTLKTFATTHHLTSISQLKGLGPLNLGDYPPERTRYEGYVGLKQAYGLTNLQFVPLAEGSPIYNALDAGQVQVGDAFSTDPQLLSGKYTPLSDPKHIFGFQHVALVIKASLLKRLGPAFQRTYAAVTNLLTTRAMQAMNKAVAIDKQSPALVAQAFLKANHMLGS
ncbi:MAG: ABC transporter substrate-binding protein [Streptosporangiaceae bacterium]